MPRIVELKEIDGDLWVRIERSDKDEGSIAIYTDDELAKMERDVRLMCAEIADEADRQDEIDNGAAMTGGAAKAAQMIRDYK